ncbi:S8 family serine peptidase [uncultured Winogradskyella sp.]|uniref:S8 family serine peptidase n=1 Tax=uncultured Winogradskyella sp. TaxID=395353 RepID=UPI0026077E32|nr:S8 family serine peptidase [uncultured Winogradskyella sp.]
MKIKVLIVLSFSTIISFAQQTPSFFVKIQDSNYMLIQTHDLLDNKIATFNSPNRGLNSLISKYKVYEVEHVFKNSQKTTLQNVYLVRCNDIKLMDDLNNNFSNYYTDLFDLKMEETLVIPNDFGMTGGFLEHQEELNYIRAPEAWDLTTGSSDVIIGIADNSVQPAHEDLAGKVNVVYGTNCSSCTAGSAQHGSEVSSMAAANTNNGLGMAAIGYNSTVYNGIGRANAVDALSQISGVKVINTAWVSSVFPEVYDEVVEDRKVVVVGSAGNGIHPGSTQYVNPAAFKNVISVSSIAHETNTWTDTWGNYYDTVKDNHVIQFNSDLANSHQHNDSVDIVAPGYGVLVVRPQTSLTHYVRGGGTSFASPQVSGTIALMFDVNYCIDPKEVETILKLTAVKIDTIPANLPFYGKLGAGKLDAYEAVKMSKDMAEPFGTVEVKNRILYRPWFYKLETAPYEIKMSNNNVSQGSKLKFRARQNIEILSGEYFPGSGGYVDLQINPNLDLNHCPPRPSQTGSRQTIQNTKREYNHGLIEVFPTLVINDLTLRSNSKTIERRIMSVEIYDFFGVKAFEANNVDSDQIVLNLKKLRSGIYIVKILDASNNIIHTEKIIKK